MVLEPVKFASARYPGYGPYAFVEAEGYALPGVPHLVLERWVDGAQLYWTITHLPTGAAVGFDDKNLARLARYLERLGPLCKWEEVKDGKSAGKKLREAVKALFSENEAEQQAEAERVDIFEVALEMTREAVDAQVEAAR